MNKRVMIIGPNGVGKTKIAYGLARRHGGEVVNLDRTYLYRHFPITTGLADTLNEVDVPRHLYEILEPDESSFSTDEFSGMVTQICEGIANSGKLAIAEGASTKYVPSLLALNAKQRLFDHVIALTFPVGYDIESKYQQRIEQAFSDGLIEEISGNLARYRDSFLIKECHFSAPTEQYLQGKMSLVEAKSEILRRCLQYKDRQLRLFAEFPEVRWLEISAETPLQLENLLKLPVR